MKYSFIVPAYNIEAYISQCVNSILSVDYNDYEVIIVNDGSTDNTLDVIKRYSHITSVRFIDKPNGGLSAARNDAILLAQGDYLVFVDGDDIIKTKTFLKTIDSLPPSDVYCFPYFEYDGKTFVKIKRRTVQRTRKQKKLIRSMVKTNNYFAATWTKIVKREFLITNNLFFNAGLSEDLDWSYRILLFTNKILFVDEPYYAYRINRTSSITNKVKTRFIEGWCEIIERCLRYFDEYSLSHDKDDYLTKTLNIYLSNISYLVFMACIRENDKLSYLPYYEYLKYGKGLRITIIRVFIFAFGHDKGFSLLRKLIIK